MPFITCLVIFFIFFYLIRWILRWGPEKKTAGIESFMASIGMTTLIATTVNIYIETNKKLVTDAGVALVAVKSTDGFQGQFVFGGGGNVGDVEYYSYFYKTANNGYTKGRVDATDNTTIHEDAEPETASLKKIYKCNSESWYQYFTFEDCTLAGHEFHIPPGSLVRGFRVE